MLSLRNRRVCVAAGFVTFLLACTCNATNWHTYYTNCLYVYVPAALNSQTVFSVRVEYGIVTRADQFGPPTNTVLRNQHVLRLERNERGFTGYIVMSAERHRLAGPYDLGVSLTKIIRFEDGTRKISAPQVRSFDGADAVRCGGEWPQERLPERAAAAGQALHDAIRRHMAGERKTNDTLFIAYWGYAS